MGSLGRASSHNTTGGLEARIRHNMGWTALKMTVVYVSCWGFMTVYCLMRLSGVQPPIEFAMFAGWMNKWGPILDVVLHFIFSAVYRTGGDACNLHLGKIIARNLGQSVGRC